MDQAGRDRGSSLRPFVVGALVACLVVLLGAAGLSWWAPGDDHPGSGSSTGPQATTPSASAPTGLGSPQTGSPQTGASTGPGAAARIELQELLDRRAAAVRSGDEAGWLAPLDRSRPELIARQRSWWQGLRLLPMSTFTLRPAGGQPSAGALPGRTSVGPVEVTVVGEWGLTGHDARPAHLLRTLVVRRTDDGWQVLDDRPATDVRSPLDLDGLAARTTPAGAVLGNASATRMDEVAALLPEAQRIVDGVWGPSTTRPVVVLPATEGEFAALAGRAGTPVRGVAAVTYGELERGQVSRGDKVIINPVAWERLGEQGRRIVLTHELVHRAIRTTTTHPVPQWLSEGYAVWVGYHGLHVDRRAATPELLARVRSQGPPTDLPEDAAFDRADPGTAYDESWLAVERLVQDRGEAAVTGFYRALAAGAADEQAWRRLGTTRAALVADWRRDLEQLSRPG
ncbi:hypothetical protein [Arsenicicoccus dermatophilus]|uniref:hypothetical protein n=1 Tax=Arsenicicoccus dermatophilus TaxID=1076331 RepID=UPI001F4CA698|nr:hypothetical protein [Arsenicicoccus dermatophilus]MCH8612663.1 hypothetical protein [Arsenicicoccus dermatophilus]